MITVRNEFETIPAFEVITGSSYGGYTTRMMAMEVLNAVDTVSSNSHVAFPLWKDLASVDQPDELDDVLNDAIALFTDNAILPPSCTVEFEDNELTVLPYVDDDVCRVDELPDEYLDDVIYVVNDHGNVTCYEWTYKNGLGPHYVEVWAMV